MAIFSINHHGLYVNLKVILANVISVLNVLPDCRDILVDVNTREEVAFGRIDEVCALVALEFEPGLQCIKEIEGRLWFVWYCLEAVVCELGWDCDSYEVVSTAFGNDRA